METAVFVAVVLFIVCVGGLYFTTRHTEIRGRW